MDLYIFICKFVDNNLISTSNHIENLKLQHKLPPINTVRVWNSVFNFQSWRVLSGFFIKGPQRAGSHPLVLLKIIIALTNLKPKI